MTKFGNNLNNDFVPWPSARKLWASFNNSMEKSSCLSDTWESLIDDNEVTLGFYICKETEGGS